MVPASVILVASTGLDIDTDGVFDEQRVVIAWLFAALIVLIACSSAFVVVRRSKVAWKRWCVGIGVVLMCAAVVIGTRTADFVDSSDPSAPREVLCGPVLTLIRSDPPECRGRLDSTRRATQGTAVASVVLLAVARGAAYPEHRAAKRERKAERRARRQEVREG